MVRRKFLLILSAAACVASLMAPVVATAAPNVLFIAVDDLNDWVGPLGGHPQVKTPHLDALAARGTTFTNAHCQAPLCNPSRASLLTGLRPSTTGIHGLTPGVRNVERTKNVVTLPQHFRAAGYHAAAFGKIFHDGSLGPKERAAEFDVWGTSGKGTRPAKKFSPPTPGGNHPAMDWGPFPDRDEDTVDYDIASAAIAHLKQLPKDKPFLLSVGFRLPHVPCFAPQKWFDLYPDATLIMPPVKDDDRADTPAFSWYLHWKLPEPRLSWLKESKQWRPLVRAYLASVSQMDSQVGRVLAALKESGHEEDTVVVLWSDHGWHLGEKGISGKNTLWDRSTRVPLIFAGPRSFAAINANQKCTQPAELLDIYPTLIDLCGLPPREGLEGRSLVPQLKDAKASREQPAITTHNQGNHAIRTENWRYIRYADGSEELYDMAADPNEWTNLAADPKHAERKKELARWLPKTDVPAAPGSAHRVLQNKDGIWHWEGKPIRQQEKEE